MSTKQKYTLRKVVHYECDGKHYYYGSIAAMLIDNPDLPKRRIRYHNFMRPFRLDDNAIIRVGYAITTNYLRYEAAKS